MTSELAQILEDVRIRATTVGDGKDDWIDHILDEQRPRKISRLSPDRLRNELRNDFLTPPTTFDPEWLNKLQQ